MKLKTLFLAAIAAAATNANAANYYVSNAVSGDNTDTLVETANGALLNGGIAAIGYFNGGAPSSSLGNIQANIDNFVSLHSVIVGAPTADLGQVNGYYQSSILQGAQITAGNALLGQGVYLFIGNAATLAASTQFAIVKVGTFADDNPFVQQYTGDAAAAATAANRVIGNFDTAVNPLGGTGPSLQLVAVPEASTALLGLLGAVGLLRRRR